MRKPSLTIAAEIPTEDRTEKVTVYIPTHNRPSKLIRAVRSVLAQTYTNIEIIVCNDGSTLPNEALDFLSANGVVLLHTAGNQGACVARNMAIELSSGVFVTGLDDDDQFDPNRVEAFVKAVKMYGPGIYFSNYLYEDQGRSIPRYCEHREVTPDIIYRRNTVHNQVFAPKHYYIDSGLFDPELPAWQDYELWIRMIDRFGSATLVDNFSYIMDGSEDLRISKSAQSIQRAFEIVTNKHPEFQKREYLAGALFAKQSYMDIPWSAGDYWGMRYYDKKIAILRLMLEKSFYKLFGFKI